MVHILRSKSLTIHYCTLLFPLHMPPYFFPHRFHHSVPLSKTRMQNSSQSLRKPRWATWRRGLWGVLASIVLALFYILFIAFTSIFCKSQCPPPPHTHTFLFPSSLNILISPTQTVTFCLGYSARRRECHCCSSSAIRVSGTCTHLYAYVYTYTYIYMYIGRDRGRAEMTSSCLFFIPSLSLLCNRSPFFFACFHTFP